MNALTIRRDYEHKVCWGFNWNPGGSGADCTDWIAVVVDVSYPQKPVSEM